MIKRYLTAPVIKEYSYKLKQKRLKAVRVGFDVSPPSSVEEIANAGGRIFVFCADGFLYEYANSAFKKLCAAEGGKPLVTSVCVDGEDKILVVTKNSSLIFGEGDAVETGAVYGDYIATYAGRIFTAAGNTIRYGAAFDFSTFSDGISASGIIRTEAESGEIKGLCVFSDSLYVFCENGVYEITADISATDFKIEKEAVDVSGVVSGSVKNAGKEILFVDDNGLKGFSNGKVALKDGAVSGTACSSAFTFRGVYCFPYINGNGEKTLYVYSFCEQTGKVISGGLTALQEGSGGFFINGEFDFGTCYIKTVTELSARADADATVKISGEGGYDVLKLKKGLNVKRTYLTSRSFSLEPCDGEKECVLTDLAFKYRITEV